jgi:hypothetical protein
MKSYKTLQALARKTAAFQRKINGMGVVQGELLEMSRRFGIPEVDGFGNFYGPNTLGRNNPEHPIIQRIIDRRENVDRLIPKGTKDRNFWLPEKLKT